MAGINRDTSTAPQGSGNVGRDGKGWGLRGVRWSNSGGGTWEPTITYLILLVIAEIFAFSALRYTFKGVHGG
jgi:hypothetical protein